MLVIYFLITIFAIFILWRILIRVFSIPCPSWASFILDNPVLKGRGGSKLLLERAHIEPGMQVLDAGCGPGRLTLAMAKTVGPEGEVLAVDIQAGMLEKLGKRIHGSGLDNIRILLAGLGEGKIQGTFDCAFMVTVLGEISDKRSALGEIFQVMKTGGILSITEFLPDPHFQSQRSVRRYAEGVGFKFKECPGNRFAYTMNFEKP